MKKIIYSLGCWLLILNTPLFSQGIIGGTNAQSGTYPWMVTLADHSRNLLEEAHLCGGTLIDEEWVLTAAHCVTDALALGVNELDVALALTDLSNPNAGYERIKVKEAFLHPGYGLIGNRNFDIALLQLETPSQNSPLALPEQGDQSYYTSGVAGKVLGWGLVDTFTYESSALLQEADITVIDLGDCNSSNAYSGEVTLDMFCAGTLAGQPLAGAATGDSGGPMIVRQGNDQWIQVGIVSWGKELWSTAQFPGVFQKTAIHRDWIESVITDNVVSNQQAPTLNADWTVYQNTRMLVLKGNPSSAKVLRIYLRDILGKTILEREIGLDSNDTYTLEWGMFPAGSYILSIRGNDLYQSKMVIKPQ